jgi:hypothetical protein
VGDAGTNRGCNRAVAGNTREVEVIVKDYHGGYRLATMTRPDDSQRKSPDPVTDQSSIKSRSQVS